MILKAQKFSLILRPSPSDVWTIVFYQPVPELRYHQIHNIFLLGISVCGDQSEKLIVLEVYLDCLITFRVGNRYDSGLRHRLQLALMKHQFSVLVLFGSRSKRRHWLKVLTVDVSFRIQFYYQSVLRSIIGKCPGQLMCNLL